MKYIPKIAAYSIGDLAYMYGVSFRKMRSLLRQLKIWQRGRRKYFPNEIRIVFAKLGIPELSENDI